MLEKTEADTNLWDCPWKKTYHHRFVAHLVNSVAFMNENIYQSLNEAFLNTSMKDLKGSKC